MNDINILDQTTTSPPANVHTPDSRKKRSVSHLNNSTSKKRNGSKTSKGRKDELDHVKDEHLSEVKKLKNKQEAIQKHEDDTDMDGMWQTLSRCVEAAWLE